jgi:hypothetical protein
MTRCRSVCCPRRRRFLGRNEALHATLTDLAVSLDTPEPKVPYECVRRDTSEARRQPVQAPK